MWGWLALVLLMLALPACSSSPNWKELYSEHLGLPIQAIDQSTLDKEFLDPVEAGTLTRVAWAQLQDGSMIFLGLPPHGIETERVLERTVVLREDEWQSACAAALGIQEVNAWRIPHEHLGNAIRAYLNNENDRYCQFLYLPNGWELRAVEVEGVIKPFR